QPEYRANREVVADHIAFTSMKEDGIKRRSFSNIVAEFTTEFDEATALKIIGGQHRFESIKEALNGGIDELHGIKVYFGLTSEQRLDAQLISNTVIAVPRIFTIACRRQCMARTFAIGVKKSGYWRKDRTFRKSGSSGGRSQLTGRGHSF